MHVVEVAGKTVADLGISTHGELSAHLADIKARPLTLTVTARPYQTAQMVLPAKVRTS